MRTFVWLRCASAELNAMQSRVVQAARPAGDERVWRPVIAWHGRSSLEDPGRGAETHILEHGLGTSFERWSVNAWHGRSWWNI